MSDPSLDDPEPQHAAKQTDAGRTYRLMRWVTDNLDRVAAGAALAAIVAVLVLEVSVPRWAKIGGLTGTITMLLVGRPVARKVREWLWDPRMVWIVDVDCREEGAGIILMPATRWRDWEVVDGGLDWVTPELAFGKNADFEAQTIEGTWRGTLSDLELMRSMQAVEECRGQLEDHAKRGFALEAQAFTVVRNATRRAVLRIVSTFERGTLPDEGEGLTDEIDSAIDQFGLERKIRRVEDDQSPEAEVPGDQTEADLEAAADAATAEATEGAADD